VTKISEARRNELGHYSFSGPKETENTEYNRLTGNPIVLIDGTYTVTYVYEDISLEDAQAKKTAEINTYADNLVYQANTNPIDGVTMRAEDNIKKANTRRKDRLDKLASEKLLNEDEKNEAKTDQKLSEFEGKIWSDADKAISKMVKLDTTLEISNFDVSAQNWNVWVAPDLV